MQERRDAYEREVEEKNKYLRMALDKDERDIKKKKEEKKEAIRKKVEV